MKKIPYLFFPFLFILFWSCKKDQIVNTENNPCLELVDTTSLIPKWETQYLPEDFQSTDQFFQHNGEIITIVENSSSFNKLIRAFDKSSGELSWESNLSLSNGLNVVGFRMVENEIFYTDEKRFYKFNLDTQEETIIFNVPTGYWTSSEFHISSNLLVGIIIKHDQLIEDSTLNVLISINLDDNSLKELYILKNTNTQHTLKMISPIIWKNDLQEIMVFFLQNKAFGFKDDWRLTAMNYETGNIIWEYDYEEQAEDIFSIVDKADGIYGIEDYIFMARPGELIGFEAINGEIIFHKDYSLIPAVVNSLFNFENQLVVSTSELLNEGFDLESFEPLWRNETSRIGRNGSFFQDKIYYFEEFAFEEDIISSIDLNTGCQIWRKKIFPSNRFKSDPIIDIDLGVMFLMEKNEKIFAIDLK